MYKPVGRHGNTYIFPLIPALVYLSINHLFLFTFLILSIFLPPPFFLFLFLTRTQLSSSRMG